MGPLHSGVLGAGELLSAAAEIVGGEGLLGRHDGYGAIGSLSELVGGPWERDDR